MSELMNTRHRTSDLRWNLLTTASAISLLAIMNPDVSVASDGDSDRPTVWLELGGQLEQVGGGDEPFSPPFTLVTPTPGPFTPISPIKAQRPPGYSYGGEGKISFEPENSDWVFSASLRYGRSNSDKHVHKQTELAQVRYFRRYLTPTVEKFADTTAKIDESHAILDFQVGKDVGLGMFGSRGETTINFGVRFAQFNSRSNVAINARPNIVVHYSYLGAYVIPFKYFHDYHATSANKRSFRGVGPSISWNASSPLIGNAQALEISADWGVNGAILFGRQKAAGKSHATAYYMNQKYAQYSHPYTTPYKHADVHNRSKFVVVPNIGGFAGVSFHYAAAKVSLGYRADFFFGAMDGGIDVVKKENRGFYGPFANISIGIGG